MGVEGANYVQYNNDQNGKQEFAPIDVAKKWYTPFRPPLISLTKQYSR
jgi:hypothetical protein